MKKFLLIAILAMLAACSAAPMPGTTSPSATPALFDNDSAQREIFRIKQQYEVALTVAVAYVNLPLCDKSKPPCATLGVVQQIQAAQPAVRQALDAAEHAVRTPGFGGDILTTSVVSANAALNAFSAVVNLVPKEAK